MVYIITWKYVIRQPNMFDITCRYTMLLDLDMSECHCDRTTLPTNSARRPIEKSFMLLVKNVYVPVSKLTTTV